MKLPLIIFFSLIIYILGALGYATRYWDCCKPSCAWVGNAGGHLARTCDINMSIINDTDAGSKCDGGPSTACLNQIPMVINETLAYAFAASPGYGPNVCGKCYELKFTGKGKYETKYNHRKLIGKKLIVISNNIGYDVSGGQFNLQIPGGGVGTHHGCDGIFFGDLGATYGGLLNDCEDEVGWKGSEKLIYEKRKSCLIKKCNTSFEGVELAKEGCLFLANWMEAAGNPYVEYEQVECPKELLDKY